MVTSQTWMPDFRQKTTRFLLIKEKVLNGKIYDEAPYFYISKNPVRSEVNR